MDVALHKRILQLYMKSVPHTITIKQQFIISLGLYKMSLSYQDLFIAYNESPTAHNDFTT